MIESSSPTRVTAWCWCGRSDREGNDNEDRDYCGIRIGCDRMFGTGNRAGHVDQHAGMCVIDPDTGRCVGLDNSEIQQQTIDYGVSQGASTGDLQQISCYSGRYGGFCSATFDLGAIHLFTAYCEWLFQPDGSTQVNCYIK